MNMPEANSEIPVGFFFKPLYLLIKFFEEQINYFIHKKLAFIRNQFSHMSVIEQLMQVQTGVGHPHSPSDPLSNETQT